MRYPPILKNIPHMLHGGDYNPDQWLPWKEEIWPQDIRLMKLADINVVSIGIFSWAKLEPEEGRFTFEWLDEIMDLLHENGIGAILATPSGARPRWLAEKYPEVLRVREDRRQNLFGERHNHCWSSPVYREKVRIINTRLAERYKNHPALSMWHISNEYSGDCHCELCQEKFRAYLKARYGTVEKLNIAYWSAFWSHTYEKWEQLESPSPLGEKRTSGLTLDWRRFITEQIRDFYLWEIAPLKAITPDIPCTTNLMSTHEGMDYFRMGAALDVVSWDNYPCWTGTEGDIEIAWHTAFCHDLMRGCGRQKPFMLMESSPSATNWQPLSKLRRPGMHLLSSMQAVAHGSDTVQYFQIRQSRGSSEKFHGAVITHEGHENTRVFRDVCEVGSLLKKLDAVRGAGFNNKVALLYDWQSRWALTEMAGLHNTEITVDGITSQDKGYLGTVLMHYRAFLAQGIGVDIVDGSMPVEQYDVVVAPMLYSLREGCAERFAKFVKGGGTLVTTYATGYTDENDLCFLKGFPGPLKGTLGLVAEEIDALGPNDCNSISWQGKIYKAMDVCELIRPEDTTRVLAAYGDDFYEGLPALTANDIGSGTAYHMAARMEQAFLHDFYRELCREKQIYPVLEAPIPEGIAVTMRTDGETEYVFVLNVSAKVKTVDISSGGKDLSSGNQVKGKIELPVNGVLIFERKGGANHA